MKAYKLTPLEQLQLEKKQLQEECAVAEKRMAFQLQYLSDNWGNMVLKGITSSMKDKMWHTIGSLGLAFPRASTAITPYVSRPQVKGLTRLLLSNYKSIAGAGWGLVKPLLWTYLTKKASSMIFGRRKKKR